MSRFLATWTIVAVTGCETVFPLVEDFSGSRLDVTHVADTEDVVGDRPFELFAITIDTDELTISGDSEAALVAVAQDKGGPELAVLRGTEISFLGNVTVVGSRPLLVIGSSIVVDAVIDASGTGPLPGNAPSELGAGGDGLHTSSGGSVSADAGGGGGGFATDGGAGGATCMGANVSTAGGLAGPAQSTPELLVFHGGGSGGNGAQDNSGTQEPVKCEEVAVGGGGGGAIQLSARNSIRITSTIDVSGGGGAGGVACSEGSAGGGGGGGAGGAIFLEASIIEVSGSLAANGGGGGGGGRGNQLPGEFMAGTAGLDGAPGLSPAAGGTGIGQSGNRNGTNGGSGGAFNTNPEDGTNTCLGQSGGGGGSAGRIVIRARDVAIDGEVSPQVVLIEQ